MLQQKNVLRYVIREPFFFLYHVYVMPGGAWGWSLVFAEISKDLPPPRIICQNNIFQHHLCYNAVKFR